MPLVNPAPGGAAATAGAPPGPQATSPNASPAGAFSALASNPQYSNQILSYLYGGQATQLAGGQLTTAEGLASAGEASALFGVQSQDLQASTGLNIASALLGEEQIGSQAATSQAQQQYELQTYGLQQRQQALTPQELALEQQYLGTQEGAAATQYGLQQQQFGIQQQQLPGQYAAQGALNTVGEHQAQQQLGIQEQQAASQYGLQQAGFQEQGGQLGLAQQNAALQAQLASVAQQSELAGYQGQQTQLGLAAQQAGIPAQQAQEQLQYGLQQLGITQGGNVLQGILQASQGTGQSADSMAAVQSAAGLLGGLGSSFGFNYGP